ncbi:MAG: transporter substrate-binding domain-containing protein, partial [Spirochaetaceae bacterium]|nr:transporter substrate-binding domain-containing protein [Spirochaetaceae bacterium]
MNCRKIELHRFIPILLLLLSLACRDIPVEENEYQKIIHSIDDVDREGFLSPEEVEWLQNHRVITLGFTDQMEPLLIRNEDGSVTGIYPEIFHRMEELLEVEIRIEVDNWTSILARAERREIDGLLASTPPQAAARKLLLTNSFQSVYPIAYVREDSNITLNSLEDFSDYRVAYPRNVQMLKETVDSMGPDVIPMVVDSSIEALSALINGSADIAIVVSFEHYLIHKNAISGVKLAFLDYKHEFEVAASVRDDWPELKEIIDKTLEQIGIKDAQQILHRWYSISNPWDTIGLTREEKAWLIEHPIVRVASDPRWAPIEYLDADGRFRGISMDYLKELEILLGIDFEIVEGLSWEELLHEARSKNIDMFSCVAPTQERSEYLNFTQPYLSIPIKIFSVKGMATMNKLEEHRGKIIAVVSGYAIETWLRRDYPEMQLISVSNPSEALKLLSNEEVDAFVGNQITTSYYIYEMGISNVSITGKTPYFNNQSIAVRDDWPLLTEIIQKGLSAIPESKKNEIYRRWVSPLEYVQGVNIELLLEIIIPLLMILLFVIFLNWRMRKEVKRRKEVEQELRKAKDEAISSTLAKSQFLANMSHEIRTPLNTIIGFIDLAMEADIPDKKILPLLKTAKESAGILMELINDILDISKLESGKMELNKKHCYLPHFLESIMNTMDFLCKEKALNLELNLPGNLQRCIIVDSNRLRQVLINLLGNAVKFTEKGSVSLSLREEEGNILFSVEDTGIGMTEQQINKIFNPFTQGDETMVRRFGGTGLGTTISKELVELMGGEIELKSEFGKGSVFSFTLPDIYPEEECTEDCRTQFIDEANQERNNPRRFSLLLAEDIEANRTLAKIRLVKEGHRVEFAKDGNGAIKKVIHGDYDAVLMDIHMPRMDGLEATKRIRKMEGDHRTPVVIIAITASITSQDKNNYSNAGFDGVIGKPIDFNMLFDLLEYLIPPERSEPKVNIPPDVPQISILNSGYLPREIPGINIQQGLDIWKEDEAFLSALTDFSKRYASVPDRLEKKLQQGKNKEAFQIIHDLKGITGYLGFTKFYNLTVECNRQIKEGNLQ